VLEYLAAATAEHAAASGGEEHHAEAVVAGISFLTPGFFVAAAMLIVFAIMLKARVPSLIAKALDSRIDGIRQQLDEAAKLRAEAEALRDDQLNKRPLFAALHVRRGAIRAADGTVIARSVRQRNNTYERDYPLGELFGHPVGYAKIVSGELSGLERSRNDELSGPTWELNSIVDQLQGKRRAGNTVVTTLDPDAQRAATDALGGQKGAVVALDPRSGAVRALVGGRQYDDSQFNRATQGLRQPGSAFKPFVYLAALERGFSPSDVFEDAPIRLGKWSPGNYNGRFEGPVTLHHAFANSTNTIAVKLIEQVGPARVIAQAHKMGITSELRNDASLALGTSETSLLELTTAYAPFANGGEGVAAYGVEKITDPQGKVLWRRTGGGFGRVMSDRALAHMHQMMQAVITEGTGKAARLDRPAAGKSGTTQDYRDAWFIGYTADYVAGVWLGNDDQRNEMKKVTGGGLPAQLWKNIMLAAHQGLPPRPLPTPDISPPPTFSEDGPGAIAAGVGQAVREAGNALDSLFESIFGR